MRGRPHLLSPLFRRSVPEGAAFSFLLLTGALTPLMAPANIALAGAIVFTLVWRLLAARRKEPFLAAFRRPSTVFPPLCAFLFLSVLSSVFSTLPSRSMGEIKGLLTFLILPIGISLIRRKDDAELLARLLKLTMALILLRAALELHAGHGDLNTRLTGGLSNHMTFAGLLLPFTLLFFEEALEKTRGAFARGLSACLASAGVFFVFLSLTRSAYLGLATGLVLLLLLHRPRLAWGLPFLLLLMFVVSPGEVRSRAFSLFDPADDSARDRMAMWKAGQLMIKDHPLLGVGPGRVGELYSQYRQPGHVEPRVGHLHNNIIMIAAETGTLSALAYLWLLGAFYKDAWRRLESQARGLVRASMAGMAALFVAGLFEYNFGDVEVLRVILLLMTFSALEGEEQPVPMSAEAG